VGNGIGLGLTLWGYEMNKLYRHYDSDGVLLYIGISLSFMVRLASHRHHKHWFNAIAMTKYENFATRREAAKAEKLAIKSEKPLHNIAHNNMPVRPRKKDFYIAPDEGSYFTLELPFKVPREIYTIANSQKDAVENFRIMLETLEFDYWANLTELFCEIYLEEDLKQIGALKIESTVICPSLIGIDTLERIKTTKRNFHIQEVGIPNSLVEIVQKRHTQYLL
jgi:predicted GIY-YIG superfamily endonuclease